MPSATRRKQPGLIIDRDRCTLCACVQNSVTRRRINILGRYVSVRNDGDGERDRQFYKESGGA
jgi:hypothetical protein